MSLFPAYSKHDNLKVSENACENENEEKWLSNSSYKIQPPTDIQLNKPTQYDSSETDDRSNIEGISLHTSTKVIYKHKKKDKKKDRNKCSEESNFKNKNYIIDKLPQRVYLTVATISRPAVSKYNRRYCVLGNRRNRKYLIKKSKRYYNNIKNVSLNPKDLKDSEWESNKERNNDDLSCTNVESDITEKTGYYNQELGKDPFNVDMWLKFIQFQDIVWQFEKTYRRGSTAKGYRAIAERKLSILDKALTHNPSNVSLVRERLATCEKAYPADELSAHLEKLVSKDQGNIILWQGFIEATQCSMSRCNTPAVVNIYNECLGKLHQLRRFSSVEKSLLEERILCMLYQCGLFLRQAGLWEQLWTLLRLYLVLNLAPSEKNKFIILTEIDEKQLFELEELILDSKLPLHELWLRMERLRECCHWLPWTNSEPCEDPQRTVFIDDVSDLIHPITSTGNIFKLTVMTLTLLKMPLLPCRHSTVQQLGLDYVPWALDTIETLLPVYYPLYPVDISNKYFLKDAFKLAVGPQYLKTHPGQEEYLDFLVIVMRRCAECLEGDDRTAICIWWLRFERLLIVLDRDKKFKMPAGRLKKVKTSIKEFLKDENNRNNILFYKEYAHIEYELGNVQSAQNILLTAISMLGNDNVVLHVLNEENRRNLCSLYRTLVEFHLTEKLDTEVNKNKARTYLISLVSGNSGTEENEIIKNEIVDQALEKYKQLTTELLCAPTKILTIPEHFLPDFLTDWIICQAWLVYLAKSPFESGTLIEETLSTLEEGNSETHWRREVLMEWYVSMVYKTCTEQLGCGLFGLFSDILNRSLSHFPNNLYLLTLASKEQSNSGCVGKSWWKLSNLLSKTGHAIPALFLVIITNQELAQREDQWSDFKVDDPMQTISSITNRMLSTFRRLTKVDICTKRCGLVWRLYLQFLYSYRDPDSCRNVYFSAVDECPWLKALYIDAAIYIPAELPQIQDLIIEKQLRLHVTPEELEILRT